MSTNREFTNSETLWSAYQRALGNVIKEALANPDVVEVYRNEDGLIWTDKIISGRSCTGEYMSSDDARQIIELVADSVNNNTFGPEEPYLAAEMPKTGERFQAMCPPIVEDYTFTIRKRIILVKSIEDYVNDGSMTQKQADYIKLAVTNRINIMVAGGTGAGKTTLVNAIMDIKEFKKDRIYQVEDRKELQCNAPDIVRVLTGEFLTTQQAIWLSLRMRPDKHVVGEVREGGPAQALAKVANTGHPGCLSTIHCDSASEAYDRMAELILEVAVGVPHRLIRRALGLVIHIARIDGKYKVTELRKCIGYDKQKEEFITEVVAV